MMSFDVRSTGPLADIFAAGSLTNRWLKGEPVLGSQSASADLTQVSQSVDVEETAPLWRDEHFAAKLPPEMKALKIGPRVIVTGQQPGFLGGPLLTLYKIATAVVLAKRLSEEGQPTVPVFWSGDDDDDLAEALAPYGWQPDTQKVWRSQARRLLKEAATQRTVLAEVTSDVWAAEALQVLGNRDEIDDNVYANMRRFFQTSVEKNTAWGIGQAELIETIFAGTGLVVIRGNDERMHGLASTFYEELWESRSQLKQLAAIEGQLLRDAGFQAQINNRSLASSMFEIVDSKRVRLADGAAKPKSWQNIRPGVMLRSMVQDWLLRPSGVVVGPSEYAYLKQLEPLYKEMHLPRCPLVPRLSAWIAPQSADSDRKLAQAQVLVQGSSAKDDHRATTLSDDIVKTVQTKMREVLVNELGVAENRATAMSAGRARRFRKGVLAMLNDEVGRQRKLELADLPAWLAPEGGSQERELGWVSAIEIWGGALVPAILAAAESHLEWGDKDSWQQFAILANNGKVSW